MSRQKTTTIPDTEAALRTAAPEPPRLSAERSLTILNNALAGSASAREKSARFVAGSGLCPFLRPVFPGIAGFVMVTLMALVFVSSIRTPSADANHDFRQPVSGRISSKEKGLVTLPVSTPAVLPILTAAKTHRNVGTVRVARRTRRHVPHSGSALHSVRSEPASSEPGIYATNIGIAPEDRPPLTVTVTNPAPGLTVAVRDHAPESSVGFARVASIRVNPETGSRVWVQCDIGVDGQEPYIVMRGDTPAASVNGEPSADAAVDTPADPVTVDDPSSGEGEEGDSVSAENDPQ